MPESGNRKITKVLGQVDKKDVRLTWSNKSSALSVTDTQCHRHGVTDILSVTDAASKWRMYIYSSSCPPPKLE